ncbi:MAG: hypothetical protein ACLR23_18025 [Clostridia bacterium]
MSLKLGERDEGISCKEIVGNAITMLLIIGVVWLLTVLFNIFEALMYIVCCLEQHADNLPYALRLWKNYFLRHTLFHH